MKKIPDILTLLELARLLAGKDFADEKKEPAVETFHAFLVRAARPFNPSRITDRDDLIAFFKGTPVSHDEYWDLKSKEVPGQRSNLTVSRDYFLNLIYHTGERRYPKLKSAYAKTRFWD